MAYTQSQLAALENAIVQGASKVKWPGGEVEYMPLEKMLQIRDMIRRELRIGPADGGSTNPTFDKGL